MYVYFWKYCSNKNLWFKCDGIILVYLEIKLIENRKYKYVKYEIIFIYNKGSIDFL